MGSRPQRGRRASAAAWRSALPVLLLLAPAVHLAADEPQATDGDDAQRRASAIAAPPPGPAPEHGKAVTRDASPVGAGAAELELAYTPWWKRRDETGGPSGGHQGHQHALTATLTYGVSHDVDLNVGAGVAWVHDETARASDPTAPEHGTGLSDVVVGARWRFLNAAGVELAVVGEAVIPEGTRGSARHLGVSQGYWSAYGALVGTKDFGLTSASVEAGFGAPVYGDAGGTRTSLHANAAVGHQVLPWLQPEVELNYTAMLGSDPRELVATAGLLAPLGRGHRLTAALQRDVWSSLPSRTIAVIVAFKMSL